MGTITLRLPDDIYQEIMDIAVQRKISISKLYEEISTVLLKDFNAEMRFRKRVAGASIEDGVIILDKL
jgi:predicted DNA-binding ribbon-helix-helix protein